MQGELHVLSESPERTTELGRRIGAACRGGEVILLSGELGAGKTGLTGGIAEGMGVTEPAVSPTYIILRSYAAARGLTLHHLDLYRLEGEDDLESVGIEDCLTSSAVTVVEWPERCPGAFDRVDLRVRLEHCGEEARQMIFSASHDGVHLIEGLGI